MSNDIRKIETIPATKTTAPVEAKIDSPPADPKTPEQVRLEAALLAFKTANTGRTVSPDNARKAMRAFANAVDIILANPRRDLVQVMNDFFVAEKAGVCQETVALVGLNSLSGGRNYQNKVALVYNTFRAKTMGYTPMVSSDEFTAIIPIANLYRFIVTTK